MRTDLEPVVRVGVSAAVRSVDPRAREVVHLISTPTTDRAGDIVEPLGADISDYTRNPIVLANHSYKIEDIIGKAVDLTVRSDGILSRTRFLDTPLAEQAFALASAGLGGWSIGFKPIESEVLEDRSGRVRGTRFTRWSLLEYSSVAIPMNQDVVNNAVARGLVSRADVSRFFLPSPGGLVAFPSSSSSRRAGRGEWSAADKRAFARAVRDVRAEIDRALARLRGDRERWIYDRD